jgi:hypothetical protein
MDRAYLDAVSQQFGCQLVQLRLDSVVEVAIAANTLIAYLDTKAT